MNKVMLKIYLLMFVLALFSFSCSNQRILIDDEFEVDFPIAIDTLKINRSFIVEPYIHQPYFHLTITNIKKIKIDEIFLDGIFNIEFDYQPSEYMQDDGNTILFYEIFIEIIDGNYDEYFKKINDHFFSSFYHIEDLDEVMSIIDTKNEMIFVFNKPKGLIFILKEH